MVTIHSEDEAELIAPLIINRMHTVVGPKAVAACGHDLSEAGLLGLECRGFIVVLVYAIPDEASSLPQDRSDSMLW